jgi:hypothetical protein
VIGGPRTAGLPLHLAPPPADTSPMGPEALSTCLWEERQALEELAYRLEAELLVVASGRTRWLPRASAAVSDALAEVAARDARRASCVAALAAELGLAADVTIEALAEALPDHADALRSHRRHLRQLLAQVDDLTRRTRALLARHLAATTDALAMLGVAPDYPGPSRPGAVAQAPVLVDARA